MPGKLILLLIDEDEEPEGMFDNIPKKNLYTAALLPEPFSREMLDTILKGMGGALINSLPLKNPDDN